MRAAHVIGPNSDSGFWDVPGTDKMIHSYRIYDERVVYEVIEPSSVTGPHQTITFLSDGQSTECYGTVSTRRADKVLSGLEGAERTKVYRAWISELYCYCYWTIINTLDLISVLADVDARVDMGRIEI